MSTNRAGPHRHDRDLAQLALALARADPRGRSPDLSEIDQWRTLSIAEPRRAEILSHLARDPRAFELLIQLERAEAELAAEDKHRTAANWLTTIWSTLMNPERLQQMAQHFGKWIHTGTGGAFVAITASLLFLIGITPWLLTPDPFEQIDDFGWEVTLVQVPSPRDWSWSPSLTDMTAKGRHGREGPGAIFRSREEQAFRAGVRQALSALVGEAPDWTSTLAALPSQAPDCKEQDPACAAGVRASVAAGDWATRIYWQCRASDAVSDQFWQRQAHLHDVLLELLESAEPGLAPAFSDWTGDSPQARLCSGVNGLLDELLAPWR